MAVTEAVSVAAFCRYSRYTYFMISNRTTPALVQQRNVLTVLARIVAWSSVMLAVVFLVNNYLTFWRGWPGAWQSMQSVEASSLLGWMQLISYPLMVILASAYVYFLTSGRLLRQDEALLGRFAGYLIRAAFWSVLMIGLADFVISVMRVEGWLNLFLSDELSQALGRPQYRGHYVHWPLVGLGCLLALVTRTLGFIWLCLLIVLAEFLIVIFRFVFSYEQVFMGDLVRFWYAALFLFASAHTLVLEGHVRVDVLYAGLKKHAKAKSNIFGILFLGLPLCWTILMTGMWGKSSSINSPLLSYEIAQSGFGLYVKYLMVGFLVIFALSMIVQFSSYLLGAVASLQEPDEDLSPSDELSLTGGSH